MLIKHSAKTVRQGSIALHYLKDPDTPLIVEVIGKGTATYDCATGTGDCDGWELTQGEIAWLETHRAECEKWYDEHRVIQ